MKKMISIFLLIAIMICLPITSYAVSGKGTEANPFRITNEEELLLLADFPECYFELENDVKFTGTWEPVADFSGSLDGKGHTITVSDYMSKTNMGFFGTLSGSVKNLTINANRLNEGTSSPYNIGLFAGICSGTIENSKAVGSFSYNISGISDSKIGGFCGVLSGSIKESISWFELLCIDGGTPNYHFAGGICGKLTGTVEKCANKSNVKIYSCSYGGIASVVQKDASVTNSMNLEASLYLNGSVYAGIAGDNCGTLTNCYSVTGTQLQGSPYGISHLSSNGTMTNCYYDKVVLGNSSTSCGIPKSTLAMKMETTYTGWDFENVWAIDESEENPINDGYPYLRVFYEDVATPVTMSSISAENGKLVIDTKITDTSDDYTLHIALYDNQNRLCDYLAIPNERQLKDVFVVYPDINNAAYAKIFTWYSTDNIQPVSTCETVTISR